jgi:hypothetical protein
MDISEPLCSASSLICATATRAAPDSASRASTHANIKRLLDIYTPRGINADVKTSIFIIPLHRDAPDIRARAAVKIFARRFFSKIRKAWNQHPGRAFMVSRKVLRFSLPCRAG